MKAKQSEITKLFEQVNRDCARNGEQIVPLSAANAEYYRDQMINLEYAADDISAFLASLEE